LQVWQGSLSLPEIHAFWSAHQPHPAWGVQVSQELKAEQPAQHWFWTVFAAEQVVAMSSVEKHEFEEEHQAHAEAEAHSPQLVIVEQ
jgi:hypothetical protein